jgi:hypothetical protein
MLLSDKIYRELRLEIADRLTRLLTDRSKTVRSEYQLAYGQTVQILSLHSGILGKGLARRQPVATESDDSIPISLKSIGISSSIETIASSCFRGCATLVSVIFQAGHSLTVDPLVLKQTTRYHLHRMTSASKNWHPGIPSPRLRPDFIDFRSPDVSIRVWVASSSESDRRGDADHLRSLLPVNEFRISSVCNQLSLSLALGMVGTG